MILSKGWIDRSGNKWHYVRGDKMETACGATLTVPDSWIWKRFPFDVYPPRQGRMCGKCARIEAKERIAVFDKKCKKRPLKRGWLLDKEI